LFFNLKILSSIAQISAQKVHEALGYAFGSTRTILSLTDPKYL